QRQGRRLEDHHGLYVELRPGDARRIGAFNLLAPTPGASLFQLGWWDAMVSIVVTRVIEALIALVMMSLVIFFLSRLTGDPVALLLGDGATEADKLKLIGELGLDQSIFVQYLTFLGNALTGDF